MRDEILSVFTFSMSLCVSVVNNSLLLFFVCFVSFVVNPLLL